GPGLGGGPAGGSFVRGVVARGIVGRMKLRSFEIRWAAVIGRALLPTGLLGGVVDDVDLGEAYRIECAEPPWYAALLLRFSLWLTWLAPPLVLRRFRTFGGLDRDAR